MKLKLLAVFLLMFVTFTLGCGEATLDGSSEDAFQKSFNAMLNSLDRDHDKSKLRGALSVLDGRYRLRRNLGLPQEGSANTFLEAIDGKTFNEVLQLAGMKPD